MSDRFRRRAWRIAAWCAIANAVVFVARAAYELDLWHLVFAGVFVLAAAACVDNARYGE